MPVKQGKISFGESVKQRLSNTALTLQQPNNMLFRETVEKELISGDKKRDEGFLSLVKENLIDLELLFKCCHTVLLLSKEGGEKIDVAGNEDRIRELGGHKGSV